MDPYFFIGYLDSLREPCFVEERRKSLHPDTRTATLAMQELTAHGLLETFEESCVVCLAFDHEPLFELLESVERGWDSAEVRRSRAAALGDWELLTTLVNDSESAPILDLHRHSVAGRAAVLVANINAGVEPAYSLYALRDLKSPLLDEVVRQALVDPLPGVTAAALEVVASIDDADWSSDVEALVHRTDGNGEIPQPYIWCVCARYLLRRGRSADIKRKLPSIKSNCLGDAALLSLEHFPEIAVETFRRALRSEIPCNRITTAAALAIADQRGAAPSYSGCRSALMTIYSQEAHQKVRAWEARHPRTPEEGPSITLREVSLCMSDEMINCVMQTFHDRVLPLWPFSCSLPVAKLRGGLKAPPVESLRFAQSRADKVIGNHRQIWRHISWVLAIWITSNAVCPCKLRAFFWRK